MSSLHILLCSVGAISSAPSPVENYHMSLHLAPSTCEDFLPCAIAHNTPTCTRIHALEPGLPGDETPDAVPVACSSCFEMLVPLVAGPCMSPPLLPWTSPRAEHPCGRCRFRRVAPLSQFVPRHVCIGISHLRFPG